MLGIRVYVYIYIRIFDLDSVHLQISLLAAPFELLRKSAFFTDYLYVCHRPEI